MAELIPSPQESGISKFMRMLLNPPQVAQERLSPPQVAQERLSTPLAGGVQPTAPRGVGATEQWPPIAPGTSWSENEGQIFSAVSKLYKDATGPATAPVLPPLSQVRTGSQPGVGAVPKRQPATGGVRG